MKLRFRSGVAFAGLLAVAVLLLRKKRRRNLDGGSEDQDVEDFTVNQCAMLRRVSEICDEHRADDDSFEEPRVAGGP